MNSAARVTRITFPPVLICIALVAAAAVGCKGPEIRPSIILISLDTLRADSLSCYGYTRETTPILDRFAHEAIRFEQTLAQSTGTLPSHISLFTSLYPPQFRITRADGHNGDQMRTRLVLPDTVLTLAEVLRSQGYSTIGFTDGGFVSAGYGMAQGFDSFQEAPTAERGLRRSIDKLAAFLSARSDKAAQPPLFLFLHTYDVHAPYRAAEPYSRWFSTLTFDELGHKLGYAPEPELLSKHKASLSQADLLEVRALYDNGIRATDAAMETLFSLLREHGLYDASVIVVLSDHGEEFLDHGDFNHGRTVYQELVRVPLLIRLPNGQHGSTVVHEPVALLDVAPTVLALAGIDVPPEFEGTSLVNAIEGKSHTPAGRDFYFESPNVQRGVHGIRRTQWKFVRNGLTDDSELYQLAADPREQDNAMSRSTVGGALDEVLQEWVRSMEKVGRTKAWHAMPSTGQPNVEALESLRALGYVE